MSLKEYKERLLCGKISGKLEQLLDEKKDCTQETVLHVPSRVVEKRRIDREEIAEEGEVEEQPAKKVKL